MDTVTFDPYDPSIVDDPWPRLAALRELAPAYRNDDYPFWALSRHADVKEALSDHATYCSSRGLLVMKEGPGYEAPEFPPGNLLLMDPPEHTAHRALVARRFLVRRVAELEARVAEVAGDLVDRFAEDGEADLVAQFATLLPATVFGEILGIPPSDTESFQRWSAALVSPAPTPEAMAAHHQAATDVSSYFAELLEHRRTHPTDDLLTELATGTVDRAVLEPPAAVGFAVAMLIAGNDTTSNLLASAAWLLGTRPDQRAMVVDDPGLLPGTIEEVLRYEPPVQGLARTLTRSVQRYGHTMLGGDKVLLLFGAANRDPTVYEEPDRFDVRRTGPGHLAFGFGIHHCVGIHLGRLEGRVGLRVLLERLGDYEVDAGAVHWRQLVPTRPMVSLPVRFPPRRSRR